MTEDFVRSVLREHTEAERPRGTDPWPAIREKAISNTPVLTGYVASGSERAAFPQSDGATLNASVRSIPRFGINFAMVVVALVAVAGVMFALLVADGSGDPTPLSAEEAFLPPGKVRHMIYTGTSTSTTSDGVRSVSPTQQHHEEFWLVAGESHPLMRTKVTVPITAETWLEEDSYYEYEPANGNEVRKRPFDSKYLVVVVPDPEIITKTLRLPNARLVGEDILEGRPVVVISVSDSNVPSPPSPTPRPGLPEAPPPSMVTYWIDRETNQILQIVGEVPRSKVGSRIGGDWVIDRTVNRIALDELIDRSELPADFFEFKLPPGATLVEE